MSEPEELLRDERFAYILQPIRDLAKNWSVDLASDLSEYLDTLQGVQVTFDGGKSTLNFTQAALLLQGSASVYSKKVDYLRSLITQVQDALTEKKKPRKQKSGDQEDSPNTSGHAGDSLNNSELEALDDAIEEGRNLDLTQEIEGINKDICLVPASLTLVPLTDADKNPDPLLGLTGELLGNMNDFKLNTGQVHSSGYLLTDLTLATLLDPQLSEEPFNRHDRNMNDDILGVNNWLGAGDASMHHSVAHCGEEPVDDDDYKEEDLPAVTRPWTEGVNGEGPGLVPVTPVPGVIADDRDESLPNNDPASDTSRTSGSFRRTLRLRGHSLTPEPPPARDPWEELDTYEELLGTAHPAKKGNPFKVPPSTKLPRKGSRQANKGAEARMPLGKFLAKYKTKGRHSSAGSTKCPEFNSLYEEEIKKEKQERKVLGQPTPSDPPLSENDDDDDDGAGDSLHDNDDDDGAGDNEAEDEALGEGQSNAGDPCPMPHVLFDVPAEEGLGEGDGHDGAAAPGLLNVTHEYGLLVKNHVEAYLKSARGTVDHPSGVSDTVAKWTDKMEGIMESEENNPFDIRSYGSAIMSQLSQSLSQPGPGAAPQGALGVVSLHELTRGKSTQEVCRFFAATLQLANSGNLRIHSGGLDQVSLEFVDDTPHYENLTDGLPAAARE